MDNLITFGRVAAVLIGLLGAVIGAMAAWKRYQTYQKKKAIAESELSDRFLKQFHDKEISDALSGYVIPHCSPGDPANKEGEEYLADTREPIFSYMDRNLSNVGRSYHLVLADTGMGKTTFCINYYAHVRRRFPEIQVCLVSLAAKNCDANIRAVVNKSDTLLIADAFDEDTKGWDRGRDRLSEILELAADFRAVIITCRSQYFTSDDIIPRETPLPVLIPKQLGQSPTFSLVRSYISPFSREEISRYIRKHFPLLYFWKLPSRKRAWELVESIPDLAHRPMLLERLPELARKPTKSRELYDLYELLVDGWLQRESRWIDAKKLEAVSIELALHMYKQLESRAGRLRPEEIEYLARDKLGESPDWKHLTSRSLLNRDSRGNYKFSHKSILEFLVVKAACEGDNRALDAVWTPFMKEIFVSWGHSDSGREKRDRGREILQSERGRRSIAPLFDMLDTSSSMRGIPDFERCAERRKTATGERLAPSAWRSSSIDVFNKDGRGVINIKDAEFNLCWSYIPLDKSNSDLPPVKLVETLNFIMTKQEYRLPSYEQFISLIEGLYKAGKNIIPENTLFLLEDKPARNEHILVDVNSDVRDSIHMKCIDRKRKIGDTPITVNAYLTGVRFSRQYAGSIIVDQLYIEDTSYIPLDIRVSVNASA